MDPRFVLDAGYADPVMFGMEDAETRRPREYVNRVTELHQRACAAVPVRADAAEAGLMRVFGTR